MKIMCVSRIYPTHRAGGMGHVCQDRARALAAAGHEVHVVTTARGTMKPLNAFVGSCCDDVRAEGGMRVQIEYTNSEPQKWSQEFAICCEAMCEHLKPDILHLDSFDREHPWWVGKVKRVAITMHGFGWGAWQTKWNLAKCGQLHQYPKFPGHELLREAYVLSQADVVIGISRHEWTMLRDQYGLRQAKLVYNPIPDYFFDRPNRGDDGSGFGQREEPAKYPPRSYFLCAAVSGQVERGFRQAKEACARAGVEFRSVKDVPREQMPAVYDGAKALLLPTAYAQGWDLSVAEARARGVPAIMSSTGSYLQEAEPFDRLVRPLHIEDMVEALKGWDFDSSRQVIDGPFSDRAKTTADRVRATAERHRPEAHVKAWLEAVLG